jgi:hypothetical protein
MMGNDAQPTTPPQQSVIDAASNTVILAFDLVGDQIMNMPDELEKSLKKPEIDAAIRSVLTNFLLARQKTGTAVFSDQEAVQLGKALLNDAGGKIANDLLDQLKKTPDYQNLQQSMNNLQKVLKSSPLGVWLDREKGILYVIGAVLVVGGATALYVTKTGVPDVAITQLTGKSVQVFKVGRFSLEGQLLAFKPDTQTLGGALTGVEKWNKLEVDLQLGVVATGSDVKQVSGKLVFKSQDISVSISGVQQPQQKTINLGLGLEIKKTGLPGPLTINLGAVVKDGKVDQGQLNATMKTRNAGDFGVTGSVGPGENKVLATWSISF